MGMHDNPHPVGMHLLVAVQYPPIPFVASRRDASNKGIDASLRDAKDCWGICLATNRCISNEMQDYDLAVAIFDGNHIWLPYGYLWAKYVCNLRWLKMQVADSRPITHKSQSVGQAYMVAVKTNATVGRL